MDNSIPTQKESTLNDAVDANVTHIRVVSTDKSEKIPKASVSFQGTQVKVSTEGMAATNAQEAITELKTLADTKADNSTYEALDEAKADKSVIVNAGAGLTGGGTLGDDFSIDVAAADDSITVGASAIKANTVNNLTTASATRPLSASMGKTLNETKANHGYESNPKTLKQVDDDIVQLAGGVNDIEKTLIIQGGNVLTNSIRQYVYFPVKQNDVVHLVTSDVNLVVTDPLTQFYSVSLTKDKSITNARIIVNGQTEARDVYIVSDSDYQYAYLYVNPNTGVVSYNLKFDIIPFAKLKDWILSDSYTISNITYDTYGNVKTANIVYPDGREGLISNSTADTEGRPLTVTFTYGVPTIITLRMGITYTGDLINNVTINKI